MKQINIEYVDKLEPIFTKPKRVKIIVGGRGSTKTTVVADYIAARLAQGQLWCCAREYHVSVAESVHRTIISEIARLEISGFTETKNGIEHVSGGRTFYKGLARNVSAIKGILSGVNGLWIEEGSDLSEATLRVLSTSIRLNALDTQKRIEGKDIQLPEILITMNRELENDPVVTRWLARAEEQLAKTGFYEDDLLMVVEVNYTDMPQDWFTYSGLEVERLDDKERFSPAEYSHKWDGKYLKRSDSVIFHNWKTKEFEAPEDTIFYYGADFGYSQDPTVLTRCYIEGRDLYIDYEVVKVGCEILDTPALFAQVPDSNLWSIVADSSRPETISHIRNHGYPKIRGSRKGKGSVKDGIEFLKSYNIIVHPRCVETIRELTTYSYNVDPKTQEVTPIIDKNNHVIDSLRYAVEAIRRPVQKMVAYGPRN